MKRVISLVSLLAVAVAAFAGSTAAPAQAGTMQTYIVLYAGQSVPADAAATIASAGGTLVYSYDAIGVAITRSDDDSFRANLLKDSRIENASSTAGFGTQLNDEVEVVDAGALTAAGTWAEFRTRW